MSYFYSTMKQIMLPESGGLKYLCPPSSSFVDMSQHEVRLGVWRWDRDTPDVEWYAAILLTLMLTPTQSNFPLSCSLSTAAFSIGPLRTIVRATFKGITARPMRL